MENNSAQLIHKFIASTRPLLLMGQQRADELARETPISTAISQGYFCVVTLIAGFGYFILQ